jgi:hypothetical protein
VSIVLRKVLPLGVILFGILWLCIAVSVYLTSQKFWNIAVQTEATVVRLKHITSAPDQPVSGYLPVFQFKTDSGEKVISSPTFRDQDRLHKIGNVVLIYYDPDSPNEIRLDQWAEKSSGAILPALGGVLFFLLGFFLFWKL